MSLEEKAELARQKLVELGNRSLAMASTIQRTTSKIRIGNETLTFTREDLLKMITWYENEKVDLQTLLNELP